MPKNSIVRGLALGALVAVVAGALLLYAGRRLWHGEGGSGPFVGGPFALVDQNGKARTDAEFRGQYLLVFFGYTHCPDVCPTTLQTLTEALDKLGGAGEKVTPIFITIDPARDTPQALKEYAANFHPRLVALTGSPEAIAAVAKEYRVYYAKADSTADYAMDHTALIYLMGPDGSYIANYAPQMTADEIAKDLRSRL